MPQYQKAETGSSTPNTVPLASNCDNCPKVNTTFSSTTTNGFSNNADTLVVAIGQLHDLQREVQELQTANKKTVSFYDSTSKLNKTVRIVIIILMMVPIVQALFCAGVVYSLGIEDELPGLLYWVLGGVSIFSIIEMIVGGIKLFLYEKRMDELEKKIDALTNGNTTSRNI
jgi:uncharacterized integral membrane protein